MLQAALADCQFLDLLPFPETGFVAPEVDVGRCDVVQALVVALVVVVIDEGPDLAFKVAGQVVILQQNPVLHGLVPTFDFTLGLWVERRATDMLHVLPFQPCGQITGDVTGAVIAEQTRRVAHNRLIAARCCQGQLDRVGHILGAHVCAKLPSDDVVAAIIQNGAEIMPAPPDDLEAGEVGLPPARQGMLSVVI